jgi:hypothetical protein
MRGALTHVEPSETTDDVGIPGPLVEVLLEHWDRLFRAVVLRQRVGERKLRRGVVRVLADVVLRVTHAGPAAAA